MSEPLDKQILVDCEPAHAFDVFTAQVDGWWPSSHRRFSASRLEIEPRVGGTTMTSRAGATRVAIA